MHLPYCKKTFCSGESQGEPTLLILIQTGNLFKKDILPSLLLEPSLMQIWIARSTSKIVCQRLRNAHLHHSCNATTSPAESDEYTTIAFRLITNAFKLHYCY